MRSSAKQRFVRLLMVSVVAASTLIGFADPAGAVPVPWKNCGAAGDRISVQKFDASVWPPQAGRPITLSFQFTVGADVRNASDSISVTPASIKLVNEMMIPRRFKSFVPAGPYAGSVTVNIPSGASGSVFNLHRVAYDGGTRLLCMDWTIPIK